MPTPENPFADAPIIHAYTRAQALEDGELVDVTEWAAPKPGGMMGGFSLPVAITRSLWARIENPSPSGGDVRGRAHDVLWMAGCAARRFPRRSRVPFRVILPAKGDRKRIVTCLVDVSPGDDGAPVVTIGFPEDF